MTKVFIDLPNYSQQSNGVKCIYDLALYLFKNQISVVVLPRSISFFTCNQSNLNSNFGNIPFAFFPDGKKNDFLIACDTTPKKIIASARKLMIKIICWAQLMMEILEDLF